MLLVVIVRTISLDWRKGWCFLGRHQFEETATATCRKDGEIHHVWTSVVVIAISCICAYIWSKNNMWCSMQTWSGWGSGSGDIFLRDGGRGQAHGSLQESNITDLDFFSMAVLVAMLCLCLFCVCFYACPKEYPPSENELKALRDGKVSFLKVTPKFHMQVFGVWRYQDAVNYCDLN